eukprot:1158181-Pelagomonas_calceolata.AAC.6
MRPSLDACALDACVCFGCFGCLCFGCLCDGPGLSHETLFGRMHWDSLGCHLPHISWMGPRMQLACQCFM